MSEYDANNDVVVNKPSELANLLQTIGNLANADQTYKTMLLNRINSTGKEMGNLTVYEFMDFALECSDTHQKMYPKFFTSKLEA